MFCAIATTIEKCKTEGVVDVFQVVKALRVQKSGAVCNVVSIIVSCGYNYNDVIITSVSLRCSTRLFLMLFWSSWIHLIIMQTFSTMNTNNNELLKHHKSTL